MTYAQIRQQADRVRQIPLEAVLPRLGAQPDRHDRSKWHTDRGTMSVTGCKFMNWRSGIGGGGAIDLVLHLHASDFKAAVTWLGEQFPEGIAVTPLAQPVPSGLRLPQSVPANLARVRRYLCQTRGLPLELLEPLIAAGSLYADRYANAVFIMRDAAGRPVGAELRGTGAIRWRGLAPGSHKSDGYFAIGLAHDRTAPAVLCESAIDALSFFTLHPGVWCLSTAGATSNPAWLPALLDRGRPVYCAFDSDAAGDRFADAMLHRYPAVRRLRPQLHDWNDQLRDGGRTLLSLR